MTRLVENPISVPIAEPDLLLLTSFNDNDTYLSSSSK